MDLTLRRTSYTPSGIFGVLEGPDGVQLAVTLEHSYDSWPKLPSGEYECVRGMHRLSGMTKDFETFEITGVTGHTDILFHVGNYNDDSHGCVLLGSQVYGEMIVASKPAFARFMDAQKGSDTFRLTVVN